MLKRVAVFDNTGFDHFAHQVIAFTGTFAHTSKHRQPFVSLGDVVDKLLNQYGFTHTSTTEEANFTTLHIRSQ